MVGGLQAGLSAVSLEYFLSISLGNLTHFGAAVVGFADSISLVAVTLLRQPCQQQQRPSALAAWYLVLHSFIVNVCAGDDMRKAATTEPAAERSSLCIVLKLLGRCNETHDTLPCSSTARTVKPTE